MIRRLRVVGGLAVLGIGACDSAEAQDLDFSGEVAVQTRVFPYQPQFDGQSDDPQFALSVAPELVWDGDSVRLRVSPFARLDSMDDHRSHIDVREAYALWRGSTWEFSLGADVLFWGVTESRHLVNIVNQVDALADVNEESFLGQPMARLSLRRGTAQVTGILMTGFREREFPSREGRLRPESRVSNDARYEASAGQWAPDIALRYSIATGPLDIGLSAFYGTSREPRLTLSDDNVLRPHYDRIGQVSLDLQVTQEAWLWKLEAIAREGHGHVFGAAVGGFEWTTPNIAGSAAELGLLAEYSYDGRGAEAPFAALENDVFVGTRLTFNDAQDTALLVGGVFDLDGDARSFRLEFERRIGADWTIEATLQAFSHADPMSGEAAFEQDDFASIELARHF